MPKLIFLLLSIFLGSVVGSQASSAIELSSRGKEAFDLGVAAAKQQNFTLAEQYFLDAQAADPDAPEIWFNLGLAQSRNPGQELSAAASLKAYLLDRPNDPKRDAILQLTATLEDTTRKQIQVLLEQETQWANSRETREYCERQRELFEIASVELAAGLSRDADTTIRAIESRTKDCGDLPDMYAALARGAARGRNIKVAEHYLELLESEFIKKPPRYKWVTFLDDTRTRIYLMPSYRNSNNINEINKKVIEPAKSLQQYIEYLLQSGQSRNSELDYEGDVVRLAACAQRTRVGYQPSVAEELLTTTRDATIESVQRAGRNDLKLVRFAIVFHFMGMQESATRTLERVQSPSLKTKWLGLIKDQNGGAVGAAEEARIIVDAYWDREFAYKDIDENGVNGGYHYFETVNTLMCLNDQLAKYTLRQIGREGIDLYLCYYRGDGKIPLGLDVKVSRCMNRMTSEPKGSDQIFSELIRLASDLADGLSYVAINDRWQ